MAECAHALTGYEPARAQRLLWIGAMLSIDPLAATLSVVVLSIFVFGANRFCAFFSRTLTRDFRPKR